MNCADVRHRLLLSERPDKPGPDESRHLAGCPACHAWLRRLVRLERKITELHVPACPVPAGFLEQIAESDEAPLVRVPLQPSAGTRSVREVGRQKLALASALAATLALFTLAWWLWPPKPTPADAPWRDAVDRLVAKARTPQERVEAIARLPGDLLDEAQNRSDNSAQVGLLAEDFDKWVSALLVAARAMSPGDQAQMLPKVAERLKQVGGRADALAADWQARRPEAARSAAAMARSARDAEQRLRQLSRT